MYEQFYQGKSILVTGGAGAIGSNLVKRLTELNAKKIIVLDNLSSSQSFNIPDKKNVLFVNGDIRNESDLLRVFRYKPTVVFHLAAFFANQNSVDYPLACEDVNIRGTLKLLEYATLSGNTEKFVYTNSRGGAYGADCKMPLTEDKVSIRLGSPYYISKMAAESYCFYYYDYYKLPVTVLRLFNSFGPGEIPGQYRNVIPNFIYWAIKKTALPVTGNDSISRDFVYVDDTTEAILRSGYYTEAIGQSINVAGGKEVLISDLARLINEKTENTKGTILLGQRKWDIQGKITGSNELCRKILHFEPRISIDEGLNRTIDWFNQNWKNIEKYAAFNPGINPSLDL